MSLEQDKLTESEKKRVQTSLASAERDAKMALKFTKIAEELAEGAEDEIKKAKAAEGIGTKWKRLGNAEKLLGEMTVNTATAKRHSGEAQRAAIIAQTTLGDNIKGLPQFKKIGSKRFRRIGGMYGSQKDAERSANISMGIKKGFRIVPIREGQYKGNWLIYVLDE